MALMLGCSNPEPPVNEVAPAPREEVIVLPDHCTQEQVERSIQELVRAVDTDIISALQDENELRAVRAVEQFEEKLQEAVCAGHELTFEGEFLGVQSLGAGGYRAFISSSESTQIPVLYVYDFTRDERHLDMLGELSSGDSVRFTFLPKYNRQKVLDENPYTNGLALFLHIDLEEVSKIQDLSEK